MEMNDQSATDRQVETPGQAWDEAFAQLALAEGYVQRSDVERVRAAGNQSVAEALVEDGSLSMELRRAIESLLVQRCRTLDHTPIPIDTQPARPSRLGDFELISEIARGGMGVVYEAREPGLNRVVALKMIRAAGLAGEQEIRRFHAEAAAAAKLDHPGIVPVYGAGVLDGHPYYTMALVRGSSLSERIRRDGPLPPSEAARIVAAAAQAVQFAHARDIVHRDIKPHNILLDESGVPRIADFGLAKHLLADASLTATGQVMGTPSYMPPEQATDAAAVGPAADVYSLGATLYCALTGRPPFQAPTSAQTLHQVMHEEPAPPRRLNPDVPADMETICLKCLRKEPGKRYAGAQELADDLNRFLEGKPISARPVGAAERAALWAKRRPVAAALGGVSVLAFTAIIVMVVSLMYQSELSGLNETLTSRNAQLDAAEKAANLERDRANLAKAELARHRYDSDVAIAGRAWREGDTARMTALLTRLTPGPGEEDLRGFEWHYLRGLPKHDRWRGEVRDAVLSRSGKYLVVYEDDALRLLEPTTREPLRMFPRPAAVCSMVAFSADDRRMIMAAGEKEFVVYDTERSAELNRFAAPDLTLATLGLSDDGTLAITTGQGNDRTARVWEVAGGKQLNAFKVRTYAGLPTIHPDNGAIAFTDGTALQVNELKGGTLRFAVNLGNQFASRIAFHPTQPWLVTSTPDDRIQLWDAKTGASLFTSLQAAGGLHGSTFDIASDGSRILTGSTRDRTIRLWDGKSGRLITTRKGHPKPPSLVRLIPNSPLAFSIGMDGSSRLWDMTGEQEYREITLSSPGAGNIRFSPDSRVLAYMDSRWKIHLHDGTSDRIVNSQDVQGLMQFEFMANGTRLVTRKFDGTLDVWDAVRLEKLRTLKPASPAIALAVHPSRNWIATAGTDYVTRLHDESGKVLAAVPAPKKDNGLTTLYFRPESEDLIACHAGEGFQLIRAGNVESHRDKVIEFGAVFGPDGNRITARGAQDLVVLAFPAMTPLVRLEGHTGSPGRVHFTPDSRRLVSVAEDNSVRLWNLATGHEVLTLDAFNCLEVAVSPNGRRIAAAGAVPAIRIWEADPAPKP